MREGGRSSAGVQIASSLRYYFCVGGDGMINIKRSTVLPASGGATRLRGLVREATLAASSHNTQPWKFELGDTDR